MGEDLRKAGKFYSKIIMRNIGIFVFCGILEVVFGPKGWIPQETIYAISLFTSEIILPTMLSYSIAEALSQQQGGIFAVLAVTGILAAETMVGLLGALLSGMFCGIFWKRFCMPLKGKVQAGFEMLTENSAVAVLGLFAALFNYFVTAPFLTGILKLSETGTDVLIRKNLLPLLSFVIEPAKVLFLNNSINYGGLIPIGMQQAEKLGSSVLFLLEANPGPGFGLLLALCLFQKEKRKEYGFGALVQAVGGIHEIYFPMVLAYPKLIFPLIAGGAAGIICFQIFGAGLAGPAAPGSILVILLVTEKEQMFGVALGITVSAVVSLLCSSAVLGVFGKKDENEEVQNKEVQNKEVKNEEVKKEESEKRIKMEEKEIERKEIHHIAFICDGGMGSSAMGASILRRKLKESACFDIEVTAHAVDMIPTGIDLFVCQKNYLPILQNEIGKTACVYTVESLVDTKGFEKLIRQLEEQRQRGENE